MPNDETPTAELLAGRRALDSLKDVLILHDWQSCTNGERWQLHCRLSIGDQGNPFIRVESDWYVLVDKGYPWGSIKFCPAKEGGIVHTFQHQSYNEEGPADVPWRTGDLCLSTNVRALGRYGWDIEPYEENERLLWHFHRALEWLRAAARGQVAQVGEPFELPQFPGIVLTDAILAFCENADTFQIWGACKDLCGTVDLLEWGHGPNVLVTSRFLNRDGNEIFAPDWGRALSDCSKLRTGIWILLPSVPVLEPWQAPAIWEELNQACNKLGTGIFGILRDLASKIRDGEDHLLLLGCPIPDLVGGAAAQIHWQALNLPALSWGSAAAKGFRPNERGYWERDRVVVFNSGNALRWVRSQNWDKNVLTSRGRLAENFDDTAVLLIGAGALGGMVADLLARGGLKRLTILDNDELEAGNLGRHILGMDDLGKGKAEMLARKLNLTSPHANIESIPSAFPPRIEQEQTRIDQHDVVLDCTGNDEVLHLLEVYPWRNGKLFISLSLGMMGRRLYCFAVVADTFPHTVFRAAVNPWLLREREEYAGYKLPREGIGCWHPVFPARGEDVWLMAATAVKQVESFVLTAPEEPQLVVYEQIQEHDRFKALRRV